MVKQGNMTPPKCNNGTVTNASDRELDESQRIFLKDYQNN
jgi:hypothetical protein